MSYEDNEHQVEELPLSDGSAGSQLGQVEKLSGDVTIDDNLKLEVFVLALASLKKISVSVEESVANYLSTLEDRSKESRPVVIFSDSPLGARYTKWRLNKLRLEALKASLKEAKKRKGLELLGGVHATVNAAANLLSFFRAETAYFGREISVPESVVCTTLAGAFISKSEVIIFGEGTSALTPSTEDNALVLSLQEILDLRYLIGKEASDGELDEHTAASISSLLSDIDEVTTGISESKSLTNSFIENEDFTRIASALAESREVYSVSAKAVATGGNYRIKKSIFSNFFWGDQLSFSGGAVISVTVHDIKRQKIVMSDVLYDFTSNAAPKQGFSEWMTSNVAGTVVAPSV